MNNKMGKQLYLFIKRNQAIYLLIIYKLAYFRVLRKIYIYSTEELIRIFMIFLSLCHQGMAEKRILSELIFI